jgi:energy-coupling factor transport system ATP-binding protein
LSGGQKRRVAIASIIAMQPKVLVLDEPCAGLDPKGREVILDLIRDYQRRMGNTVILVSHSMEDVAKLCNRVIVMNKGKLAMYGTVDEIYSRGEELKSMGLNVPEITDIFLKLKASGVNCKTNIYTVEQGVKEYRRLMREVQDYD